MRTFNLFAALWLDRADYKKMMTTTTMRRQVLDKIPEEINEQIIQDEKQKQKEEMNIK